jgi:hypothetical protein
MHPAKVLLTLLGHHGDGNGQGDECEHKAHALHNAVELEPHGRALAAP